MYVCPHAYCLSSAYGEKARQQLGLAWITALWLDHCSSDTLLSLTPPYTQKHTLPPLRWPFPNKLPALFSSPPPLFLLFSSLQPFIHPSVFSRMTFVYSETVKIIHEYTPLAMPVLCVLYYAEYGYLFLSLWLGESVQVTLTDNKT